MAKMKKTEVVVGLTDAEIKNLSRSDIRYALFAYRLGNENYNTLPIIEYYLPRMAAYGLNKHDFSVDWDVAQDDPRNIVSGHIVRKFNENLNASLFNTDGSLKE